MQDDAIYVVSAFGKVSGRLVATTLTLGFSNIVAEPLVILDEIPVPSDIDDQGAECSLREIKQRTKGGGRRGMVVSKVRSCYPSSTEV